MKPWESFPLFPFRFFSSSAAKLGNFCFYYQKTKRIEKEEENVFLSFHPLWNFLFCFFFFSMTTNEQTTVNEEGRLCVVEIEKIEFEIVQKSWKLCSLSANSLSCCFQFSHKIYNKYEQFTFIVTFAKHSLSQLSRWKWNRHTSIIFMAVSLMSANKLRCRMSKSLHVRRLLWEFSEFSEFSSVPPTVIVNTLIIHSMNGWINHSNILQNLQRYIISFSKRRDSTLWEHKTTFATFQRISRVS